MSWQLILAFGLKCKFFSLWAKFSSDSTLSLATWNGSKLVIGPLLRCDTHGAFEGIHLAGEGLHLPTVLVRLLLGLAQGIVVAVSSLGEVSELSGRKQKPGSPTCLVHKSSEVLPGPDNGDGLKMADRQKYVNKAWYQPTFTLKSSNCNVFQDTPNLFWKPKEMRWKANVETSK